MKLPQELQQDDCTYEHSTPTGEWVEYGPSGFMSAVFRYDELLGWVRQPV